MDLQSAQSFFDKDQKWKNEINYLRQIVLECIETETIKWRVPAYLHNGANILLINVLKDYFALAFFKGVLLQDTQKLLVSPGENSQSMLFFKFTSLEQVQQNIAHIKAYIFEAIEIEKAGLKVELTKSQNVELVEELTTYFTDNEAFKNAFFKLTPGRQRAYNIYFSAPKSSKSKIDRIEKYIPRIMNGKGINDCTCGFSKKMPSCDGSHKYV